MSGHPVGELDATENGQPRLLTLTELAAFLQVKLPRIYELVKAKRLRATGSSTPCGHQSPDHVARSPALVCPVAHLCRKAPEVHRAAGWAFVSGLHAGPIWDAVRNAADYAGRMVGRSAVAEWPP